MDGLHVNETINCLRCQSWVQQMFPMDKDLLVDILTHRPEDVHELFSRLELAVKPAKQVLQQHMADDDNVWQGYTAVMVTTYISCVKTAKLARNIKKAWEETGAFGGNPCSQLVKKNQKKPCQAGLDQDSNWPSTTSVQQRTTELTCCP